MIKFIIQLKDILKNILSPTKLIFITESADWVIKWIDREVASQLNNNGLISAATRVNHIGAKNKILHFGSINTILKGNGIKIIKNHNHTVLTWYHIVENDEKAKLIPELIKQVDFIHTASTITANKLINLGVAKDKIIIIPLGIDLNHFQQFTNNKKSEIRNKFNIPTDRMVIGSFQKDGVGWGKGLEPKLVKGPDIFCDVVTKLSQKYKIFVLLTGPARGYVKLRLKQAGIPYQHTYLKNYLKIVNYYNALDLYLITAREEGGPQAILESWATGVPIISTKVGMAPDIIKNEYNGLLAESFKSKTILHSAEKLINNNSLKAKLIQNALIDVKKYSWDIIAYKYFEQLYKPLIKT